MSLSLSFFLAGFIALSVQVVHCQPPIADNQNEADYGSDINMETLASMLTKAGLQQEQLDDDSDTGDRYEIMEEHGQSQDYDSSEEMLYIESVQSQPDDDNGMATLEKVSTQIDSGNTVAFKTGLPTRWMTFWESNVPFTSQNPRNFMDTNDYTAFKGVVFNILRLSTKGMGAGPVRVGETVGIYYPLGKFWLGCAGKNGAKCYKATCPGKPTLKYGFSGPKAISSCYGAVFKIYARGKKDNDIITHRDDIFLYIQSGGQYISYKSQSMSAYGTTFQALVMHRSTCPGTRGTPPDFKYEQCLYEIFSIWKKGL